jgi:outer membrane protein assembly factor BamD (BamD/ComL family)
MVRVGTMVDIRGAGLVDALAELVRRVSTKLPARQVLALEQAMAREEYADAFKRLLAWIKQYGGQAPRYPEALYLRGTAELETGDYRAAHDSYKALLNDFPGSVYAEQALPGEFRRR